MARSWTGVRLLEASDWDDLHDLWLLAVADGAPIADTIGRPATRERLEQMLTRPGVVTVVAHHDERLVGFMVATVVVVSPLTDATAVTVELVYVEPRERGRGIGRLLLGRAALLAEQSGATYLLSNVPSQARDLNRFFARMSFTATVTRRMTTPAALRRRLAGEEARPLERVLARRRTQRARTGLTQPLEIVPPAAVAATPVPHPSVPPQTKVG